MILSVIRQILRCCIFCSYLCAGSFDLSLSLYAVFLIAGIGKLQKISLGGIITGILICLYAGVGIMYQDAYMTLATVVTRYTYIIIYICMIFSEKIKRTKKVSADDYRYMVRSGLLTEMLIVIVVVDERWNRGKSGNESSANRRWNCSWYLTGRRNLLSAASVPCGRNAFI